MLKRIVIPGFLSTLMVLSFSVQAERKFVAATPVVILMPHVLANMEMLEITPGQRHEIRLIANQMITEREDNDSLGLELRRELSELIARYDADINKQYELMALVAKTEKRRVEMSIECADGLRKILNKEQWTLLFELVDDAGGR